MSYKELENKINTKIKFQGEEVKITGYSDFNDNILLEYPDETTKVVNILDIIDKGE